MVIPTYVPVKVMSGQDLALSAAGKLRQEASPVLPAEQGLSCLQPHYCSSANPPPVFPKGIYNT